MKGNDLILVLAENVKRLRRERGWTQEQLAEKTGLHRTYIGAIERGERNISLNTLEKLREGLSVNCEELLKERE